MDFCKGVFLVAVLLLSGCLEAQQSLDLKLLKNSYLNLYVIRNNAQVSYSGCRLTANENWTYTAETMASGGDLSLSLSNFTSSSGERLGENANLTSLEVYCNEGYFGGAFSQ